MSEIETGGNAFPESGLSGLPNGEFIQGRSGMTLREYFAAHAPVTLSDAKIECGYVGGCCINEQEIRVVMAILSMMRFAYADVMIEARNK